MCGICGCDAANHQHHHEPKTIQLEKDILEVNEQYARKNADYFRENNILTLNLLSSPGSGKTTLLEKTIPAIHSQIPLQIIVGDQYTHCDADRIQLFNIRTEQINTGKGCHLDAHHITHALQKMHCKSGLLFIENVGNLVCPALFSLGEDFRVVILSVTEGEDKPLKYQEMFATADLVLINKIDLLAYLQFDLSKTIQYIHQLAPNAPIINLSTQSGEGMALWFQWLHKKYQEKISHDTHVSQ